MTLRKDFRARLKEWQRLSYVGPYQETGEVRISKAGMKALEKRALGAVHEFLSLTVEDGGGGEDQPISKSGLGFNVNNAGVNFNIGSENSVEFTDNVIATNYFGTKQMIETMIPLMKPSASGARIVNVSSRLGRLNGRRNRLGDITLRQQLSEEEHLCEELIDGMVAKFLEQVRHNNWTEGGWPQMFTDYSVSKLALNAYTRLVAKKLSARPDGNKIYINCYCPGWVKTAMTGWQGNISAEEGADTGVWVALLPAQPETTSKFFAERREISF